MEEKLCNTIQEFEDIFGNVPFKDLDKIKKHIKNNFIPISLIEKKIEEYKERKRYYEDENLVYDDEYYSYEIIIQVLQELSDERNNTDV